VSGLPINPRTPPPYTHWFPFSASARPTEIAACSYTGLLPGEEAQLKRKSLHVSFHVLEHYAERASER
jgi:hypothetical protein